MQLLIVGVVLSALIVGCGEQKKDVKDSVFAPQIEAKEKARAVEDKLKEAADKNREALKASEQGSEPYQKQEGY